MASELIDELFTCNASLLQDSTQRADGQFSMKRNNTTGDLVGSNAFKNHMTSTLPNLNESQFFESTNGLCP